MPISVDLYKLLEQSASLHRGRLCPRQVLGVRMGLYALELLELADTLQAGHLITDQRSLLTILETDGCFTDGISTATGCTVGRRSLRIEDYGKVAGSFVNLKTEQALRLAPQPGVRALAHSYAETQADRYQAQLAGYQVMPAEALFVVQPVVLRQSLDEILSQPGKRVNCVGCGEEIMNDRQVAAQAGPLCRACAGKAYYA